jgi:hypothetical protein
MLCHFSYYWNRHPSLAAAGHEAAVEPGGYHLSRVKFPKTTAAQPDLSVSAAVLRSLRLGFEAMRANLVPAVCVQALMLGLVCAYFYAPRARPFFNVLTDWNVHGGLLFSFVAMGATVGGLTEAFTVYLHKDGRWTREDLINMAFNFLVFGFLGILNSLFYQLQARWFGAGRSLETLALKTLVDQFIYTPFLSNPCQTFAFLWKSESFSFQSTVAKLSHFRQFYVITVLPVLVSNWCFWIPMSALIYCFPTRLQLPLCILAVSMWSMLIATLVKPPSSAPEQLSESSPEGTAI